MISPVCDIYFRVSKSHKAMIQLLLIIQTLPSIHVFPVEYKKFQKFPIFMINRKSALRLDLIRFSPQHLIPLFIGNQRNHHSRDYFVKMRQTG